ncbi:MAG: hypothetical protein QY323_04715 [Patescibacteria group bacterium]|nr:MAG: hypothetical protein QY323_04715 [Patescibacteria group bacterium]
MDSKRLTWFLEQHHAQQDPIMEAQIERFCQSPDGPIVPKNCLSIERLPEIFWQSETTGSTSRASGYGFDPQGEPYRLRVNPAEDCPYELIRQGARMNVSPSSSRWSASLAGWLSDDTPVVFTKCIVMHFPNASEADKMRLDAERETGIRVGAEMAHIGQGMKHVSVLADDALMWLEWNPHVDGTFRIMRDGDVVVASTNRRYTRFLQLPGTDKILGIWKNPDDRDIGSGIGWIDERRHISGEYMDVVESHGAVLLIGTRSGDQGVRAYTFYPDVMRIESPGRLRHITDYLGGYREYPGGNSYDYIQRSRHGFQRWMTYRPRGGLVSEPSFAAVSPIFEQDGRHRYYGITDRHLCLMELPDNVD